MQENTRDHHPDAEEEPVHPEPVEGLSEALRALARASLKEPTEAVIDTLADQTAESIRRLQRIPMDPDLEPDFY